MKLAITEVEFTSQVLQLAHLCHWRSLHLRPARTARGWRTAVQGMGVGFPDLLLLRGEILMVAELKVGRRKPTPEQTAWLAAFMAAGVPAFVWRETDWTEIERVLR